MMVTNSNFNPFQVSKIVIYVVLFNAFRSELERLFFNIIVCQWSQLQVNNWVTSNPNRPQAEVSYLK